MSFAYLWEYRVHEDEVDTFRRIYGPDGDWVQLFRRAEGHIRTELFHDFNDPTRFITTDYWTSKQARDTFRTAFEAEFQKLDERCEALTVEERCLGDFDLVRKSSRTP